MMGDIQRSKNVDIWARTVHNCSLEPEYAGSVDLDALRHMRTLEKRIANTGRSLYLLKEEWPQNAMPDCLSGVETALDNRIHVFEAPVPEYPDQDTCRVCGLNIRNEIHCRILNGERDGES